MIKLLTATLLLAVFLAEVSAQRFILPTYRPPPRRPVIIRTVRDTEREQPKWLYQGDIPRAPATGDHPVLPHYIDDVKIDPNRRCVRSLDSPSAKRYGRSVGSSGTDDAQPALKRDARSIKPFNPITKKPGPIDPFHPRPGRQRPIYVA
uniref:Lebocin-like protein n=1 Tax=Pieris rapae TaxID=64459 RepID=G3M0D7_PIERA|nr:lebocin-like protein [Pieris rapae]